MMYNTSNPAEIYSGTTWELLPDNKFLKTGSTPLQQAGSNSIKLTKANLPAEKLQVDNFSLTRGSMEIVGEVYEQQGSSIWGLIHDSTGATGAFARGKSTSRTYREISGSHYTIDFKASRSWTGMSSSASPNTQNMGNGTSIVINPEHIVIKAWKRLS